VYCKTRTQDPGNRHNITNPWNRQFQISSFLLESELLDIRAAQQHNNIMQGPLLANKFARTALIIPTVVKRGYPVSVSKNHKSFLIKAKNSAQRIHKESVTGLRLPWGPMSRVRPWVTGPGDYLEPLLGERDSFAGIPLGSVIDAFKATVAKHGSKTALLARRWSTVGGTWRIAWYCSVVILTFPGLALHFFLS
jgi:hypothetical protein